MFLSKNIKLRRISIFLNEKLIRQNLIWYTRMQASAVFLKYFIMPTSSIFRQVLKRLLAVHRSNTDGNQEYNSDNTNIKCDFTYLL